MESQARLPMVMSMREQPARESDDWLTEHYHSAAWSTMLVSTTKSTRAALRAVSGLEFCRWS